MTLSILEIRAKFLPKKLVRFLGDLKTTKFLSEINGPLETTKNTVTLYVFSFEFDFLFQVTIRRKSALHDIRQRISKYDYSYSFDQ